MARKPRLHLPGGFYHMMLRGNGGADIFFAKADRRRFLELLGEGVERFGHRLHGYCLMTNHVHLVVQAGEAPLSRAMQNLAFRFTRFVNARRKRIGHLFQGRYKALLVDADSYLLELVRYVHLNPVRAGLVADPADWPWSGHRAYLGRGAPAWLTTDWVLGALAGDRQDARAAYRAFVAAGLGEGARPEFHDGLAAPGVLGDDDFAKRVLARAERRNKPPELATVVSRVSAAYGLRAAELAERSRARRPAEARHVIAYLARASGAAPLSRLAALWGRDLSTLSHGLRRVAARSAQEPAFAKHLEELNNTISQA
jgi:REP element-mobilizing transposase RayT